MSKKTILILSHVGFDDSPYCSFVHDHAKALRKKGYSVIVLAALYWIPFIAYLRPNRKKHYQHKKGTQVIDGITIIYKKTLSLSNLFKNTPFNFNGYSYFISFHRVIKKIFKKNNICFVDAHTFEVEGYVAEKIKRRYKVKTFLTLHGTSFRNAYTNNFGKAIIKRRSNIIDRYICVSANLERMLKELDITNTKVIFNGINKFDILDVKQKHSIITVASLRKQKNVDLIIKAVKFLIHKYPDISLTIVGDGDQKNNLMIESNDLLNKNIFFKGSLDNFSTQKEMAKHDCFILPSVKEGFGIVYIEAMRNHCITIGTKHEGIDGVLVNNNNGYLIDPKVESVIEAIENAFDHPQEVVRTNGYNVSKNFGWDINAENYIELSKQ